MNSTEILSGTNNKDNKPTHWVDSSKDNRKPLLESNYNDNIHIMSSN